MNRRRYRTQRQPRLRRLMRLLIAEPGLYAPAIARRVGQARGWVWVQLGQLKEQGGLRAEVVLGVERQHGYRPCVLKLIRFLEDDHA